MEWLTNKAGFARMNALGAARVPFLFVISYDKTKLYVKPLDKLDTGVLYKLEARRNYPRRPFQGTYRFAKTPVSFSRYKQAFDRVQEEIAAGNTYLLNLTFPAVIETDLNLESIFRYAKAKFKLLMPGMFCCFSPERFVSIENDTIATYPMKGTIDAHLPDAKARILADEKETAEHVMIVDLMRNDLGMVGRHVRVERFRYIDRIKAGDKELLQVSSEVTARLEEGWCARLGEIFDTLTPAGSITGTPKRKTTEIIAETEGYDRGFYTGVFGIFDGNSVDSAVMIRFVEQTKEGLVYKSGGGITADSDVRREYDELADKVYLPI